MLQIFLDVPFEDNEEVKAIGGRWDRRARKWYVPNGISPAKFERWMTESARHSWRKYAGGTIADLKLINRARKAGLAGASSIGKGQPTERGDE